MNEQHTKIQVCRGSSALELFSNQTFCQQWDALYQLCPWATAKQSRKFAEICYSVHESEYEPLVLYATDDMGQLSGLFALYIGKKSRELVYVGAEHSEYHVWLAMPETSDSFIEEALTQLSKQFPKAHLTLNCLPRGTPLGWLEASRPWAKHVYCQPILSPLMTVGAGSGVEESLRKKGNKSRLRQIRKEFGEVTLQVIHSRQELEPFFERLMEYRDFRNASRYQNMPFHDNPLHQEFTLQLVDAQDITHASVLRAGDEVLAINIGARDKTAVHLGTPTMSPFVSRLSPGKLMVLFLGRQVGEEGYPRIDLTPSGNTSDLGYKQRFADHFDTAYICRISLGSPLDAQLNKLTGQWLNVKARLNDKIKSRLMRANISLDSILFQITKIKQMIKGNQALALFEKTMHWLSSRIHSDKQLTFYQISADEVPAIDTRDSRFHHNALHDLFLYQPATPDDDTKYQFMRNAFMQFESDSQIFTVTDGNKLRHYFWLTPTPATGVITTDIGCKIELAKDTIMLWQGTCGNLTRGDDELYQASIHVRLREAISQGNTQIYIGIDSDDKSGRQIIERMGFHRYATAVRQFRWGRTQWQWQFESND